VKFDKVLLLANVKFGKKNVINNGDINAKAENANLGFGAVRIQIIKYKTKNRNGILPIKFFLKFIKKLFWKSVMIIQKKVANILEKIINKISLCKIKLASIFLLSVTKVENPCNDLACQYKNNKPTLHKKIKNFLL
jgi:hypothetical protein